MATAEDDPTERVVAYCAPGLKSYAARLLETSGDRVREVIEHPNMAGRTDVVLVASLIADPQPPAPRH